MLKHCINRLLVYNRGSWLNFLEDNLIGLTNGKLLSPTAVGVVSKQSLYWKSSSSNQKTASGSEKSQIRQNYHEESEDGVNKQINMELYASYVYLAMAYHFDRDDVALHNIAEYFKEFSAEEREHAMKLMKFQNQRGGTVSLKDIKSPVKSKWKNPLEAMEDALELEKTVNQSLLDLHKIATAHEDAQMTDFLESEYLTDQVEDIKELGDHVTNLKRVGSGLGEYIFDKKFK